MFDSSKYGGKEPLSVVIISNARIKPFLSDVARQAVFLQVSFRETYDSAD